MSLIFNEMKGFEINYNGKITYVGVDDGLMMIFFLLNHNGSIYVSGIEYNKQMKMTWYNNIPLKIGDRFEIKFIEIDHITEPVDCVHDKTIKCPVSKLDFFLGLEQYLKNKGLL